MLGTQYGQPTAVRDAARADRCANFVRQNTYCIQNEGHVFTDFWNGYHILDQDKHHAAGKEKGYTNHVERFNNTLRQRCSRLVRAKLSFSEKLGNHIGAIKYFICHYNKSRALLISHYHCTA